MIHSQGEVKREVIMSYVRDPIISARAHYALSVKYGQLYYLLTPSPWGGGAALQLCTKS